MGRRTVKEESFAQAFIKKDGELIEAYRSSLYSQNLTPEQMSVQANKLFNRPRISLRIAELQKEVDKIASEVFNITVKQRLEWLKEITEAGLATYNDQQGNSRRESLTAARGAIETMNTMLGVGDNDQNAESLNISFTVNNPVGDIKITKGK